MSTIKDVAKDAGVSIATVSRVINNSPKASKKSVEAVKKSMQALGYRPNANARALVSQNSNTIGVLVGDISDPFFGTMIKAIDNIARENDKHILIGNGYHQVENERAVIELLINNRCDTLIVHSKALSDQELIEFATEIPGMVIINRMIPEIASRCVALDNFKGTYLATEFLIHQGHKDIAWISSNHDIEDSLQRKLGYMQALTDNNLVPKPDYMEFEQPDATGGERAMSNLLAKNINISAVLTYNDYMAAGTLATLNNNEIRVPEQISILGFDDGMIATLVQPKLTTVRYPIQLMAEQATRLSLALVNKQPVPAQPTLFNPILIKRQSVKSL
ncbi:MAG: substrate-binding domain-containing protein [Psychromonas sp.]